MSEHDDFTDDFTADETVGETSGEAAVETDVRGDFDAPATGVAAVDEVLVSVQALDDRPVEEHVAVFEQAHERLRRALDPGHG